MGGKIEEGCLAIVISGDHAHIPNLKTNVGLIVRVGKFIGDNQWMENLWEVDTDILLTNGEYRRYIEEHRLERIDNLEDSLSQNTNIKDYEECQN